MIVERAISASILAYRNATDIILAGRFFFFFDMPSPFLWLFFIQRSRWQ